MSLGSLSAVGRIETIVAEEEPDIARLTLLRLTLKEKLETISRTLIQRSLT